MTKNTSINILWYEKLYSSRNLTDGERYFLSKFTEEEWVSMIPLSVKLNRTLSLKDSIDIVIAAINVKK